MRRRRREWAMLSWGYASLALVGAVGWTILSGAGSGWNVCGVPPAIAGPVLPQLAMVGLSLLGFGLGHAWGHLEPEPPRRIERAELAEGLARARTRPQTAIVLLLMLGAVGLLVYETVALQHPHSLVAITYYVRCANVIHNYRTAGAAFGVCVLVGRWFRFPWWSV